MASPSSAVATLVASRNSAFWLPTASTICCSIEPVGNCGSGLAPTLPLRAWAAKPRTNSLVMVSALFTTTRV